VCNCLKSLSALTEAECYLTKNKKSQIMKKLATTIGLFTLMLIVTSFTTPNEIGGSKVPTTEIGGSKVPTTEIGGSKVPSTEFSLEIGGSKVPSTEIGGSKVPSTE